MGDDALDEERPPRSARLAVPRARGAHLLEREWDAIVVGAGVGALAAAVLLATRGRLKVLVLERHYEPGGLSQTFRRRRDEFEVGVHYVGQVGHRATPLRRVFDVLTEGRLRWSAFGPVYDRVRFEGREIELGPDPARTRDQLLRFSPSEARTIDRYLADVRDCARAAPTYLLARADPRHVDSARVPFRRFVDETTSAHLARIGASPRLAALLTYCSGNYGCGPDQSSFAAHAVAAGCYLDGASFPVGGGAQIARAMIATLDRHGGAVMVRAGVSEIRVRGGRALGVRLEDGRELDASIVVSGAGLATTCHRLLDEGDEGAGAMREAAARIGPSRAFSSLYLGLRGEPAQLGLDGENLWRLDVEPRHAVEASGAWVRGETSAPPAFFVSCPSANDPSWTSRRPGRTSLVALFCTPYEPFAEWRDSRRGRRGEDYERLKARLVREALAAVLRELPCVADAVDHVEMSTPVTTRGFTGHSRGEVAGLNHTPSRFHLASTPRTPIAGLALAGQDAYLVGVGGAALGGVSAASYLLGRDLTRELLFPS